MRERTTWTKKNTETSRQAATSRRADIYTMNQEHPQPSPTDYENGSPDSWAETPVPGDKMSVKEEYDGDHVKRNEIGMGEFRDDTYKHKDSDKWNDGKKYDNSKVAAERKAQAAEKVARHLLRTANDELVVAAAIDLMTLPDQVLVATLKRMEACSPDALPQQARLKRALACTKLAARTLADGATEETVEKLASIFMTIDDPTLKSIIRTVASVKVAQQDPSEDEKVKTSQEEAPGQEEVPAATAQMADQAHGLTPEETAMLDGMLDTCPPCAPAGVPAAAPAAVVIETPAPQDDLTALFDVPVVAPVMASATDSDISFDDEEGDAHVASDESLDSLFADDPEVVAQRQIASANREQIAREGGFTSVSRTASTGARKLGRVSATKTQSADVALEAIWDRP